MATKLIFVIQFFALLGYLTIIGESSPKVVCIEEEKQALVSFKRDIVDPRNALTSWVTEEDCCKWDRIVCNNVTGHVLELNLGLASLSGKISPSLLNLKHLTRLDLRYNLFRGIEIPSFLGSLGSLKYLDLTYAGFVGMIPNQLGNLSNLQHLEISESFLYSKSLDWISSLSSLEYLNMFSVNLSQASDHWLLSINNLPSLVDLRLSSCELQTSIHLPSRLNLTSLRVLDLSYNPLLDGPPLFDFIKSLTNIQSLYLSGTRFGPTIPSFFHSLATLQHLSLRSSGLQGVIPSNITNLTSIVRLDLSSNSLQGKIPVSIGNLWNLEILDLSRNSLQGKIPVSIGSLCNLKSLDLSSNNHNENLSEAFESLLSGCLSNSLNSLSLNDNSFLGHITDQIIELKKLSRISLSGNKISGPIPVSLGSLSNLVNLDISSNLLTGVVSEAHFSNLTNLKRFYASGNSLTLAARLDWITPFQLSNLNLNSWKLGPRFPVWLKSQKNIQSIEMSGTRISDTIPDWFWNFSESLFSVDLSRNQLHGGIPDRPMYDVLDLSSNELTGSLPHISSNSRWLDLSNNSFSGDIHGLLCHPRGNYTGLFMVLKLGGNHLAGDIPDCWMNWPSLGVIELGNNNLSGEIPTSMGLLRELKLLHLLNNSLSGEIPSSLQNCSKLVGLNLGLNKFVGSVPRWMGRLSFLRVLNLRSNSLRGPFPVELCALDELQILDVAYNNLSGSIPPCLENFKAMTNPNQDSLVFYATTLSQDAKESTSVATKGSEYQYDKILHLMSSLDLSSNNFSGEIPEEIANLQALKSLNFSGNHLRGRIPSKIGNMSALESLDLSRNRLLGEIPRSMSDLNFLNYLNLSYNNLSGEIPKSTQLQSLSLFSFTGNELLCGDPLPKKCRESSTENNQEEEDDNGDEEFWFQLGIGMGFGVSFMGVVAPLVLSKFWRRAYFWFFQEFIWYHILDGITGIKYRIGITTPVHLA